MKHLPYLSSLVAGAVLAGLSWSQAAAPGLPSIGGPIRVNGKELSAECLKREMVYAVGATFLEGRKLDVIIDEEIRKRVAAGEDKAKFEFTEAEATSLMERAIKQIHDQYPTLDPWDVIRRNGMTKEMMLNQVGQTLRFDRVFLPDDPRQWPTTTVTAITQSAGQEFIDKLKQAQDEKDKAKAAQDAASQPAPDEKGQDMFKMIMRKMVMQVLFESTVVRTGTDGLPCDVAMDVNGSPIKTAEVFAMVAPTLNDQKIAQTRQYAAKIEACKQELMKAGAWIPDEEFKALYAEHKRPYDQSPFKLEVIATGFKRFPSMDAYQTYFHVLKSFEKMIQPEMTDAALTAHLARASKLLGLSRVNAEMILCSAMDFGTGTWKTNGWEVAKNRAVEAAKLLGEGGGDNWDAVLDQFSEFWDPPKPVGEANVLADNVRNKGRLGTLNRNEMLQRIEESEFSMFVNGSSIVDYVFFDQEEGTIDGPFKGPFGYYLTRVISRTRPQKEFGLTDPNQRELVVQDYLAMRLNKWADDTVKHARVEGL